MKTLLKLISANIITIVLIWIITAFITLTWNVLLLSQTTRELLFLLWLFLTIAEVIIFIIIKYFINDENNNQSL